MKIINELYIEADEINLDYRRLMLSLLKSALQRSDTQLFEAMYGTGVTKEKNFAVSIKAFGYSAGSAVLNSVANLLLLIALLNLTASVQYPIVTGGVIVFSLIIDIVRKAKLKKREIIASLIAFAASAVMAL